MNTHRMNDEAKQIGDALDVAMRDYDNGRGIRQSALARLSGVPQPTISRTLSGKSVPETETLSKLVAVLGHAALGKTIAAILGNNQHTKAPTIAPLTAKIFALRCDKCGHVSHQSFIDLEANDIISCPACYGLINVADYYGQAQLAEFVKSIGATGFALRKR